MRVYDFGSDWPSQEKCSEIISLCEQLKTLIKYWKDVGTCGKMQQEALLVVQIYHTETFSLLAHRWHFLLWQSNLGWQCVLPSTATQWAVLLTGPSKNHVQAKLMSAVHSRHLKLKAKQNTINFGSATFPSSIDFISQPTHHSTKKFPLSI